MPYISKVDREKYDHAISVIVAILSELGDHQVGGHLNYILYSIVKRYLDNKGIKYHRINCLLGSIECCKQEIYRRLAVPYEEIKIKTEGDI